MGNGIRVCFAIASAALLSLGSGACGPVSNTTDAARDVADAVAIDTSADGTDSAGPTMGQIGAPCTRNGDCSSQLCLASGHCSVPCTGAAECPSGWACDPLPGVGNLCQCTATVESCNGRDDDCDAIVDNRAICPGNMICQSATCVCPPERMCGGACVDTQNDASNCGGCGSVCPSGATCVSGTCTCPGTAPLVCANACHDGATDEAHCGACGTACPVGGSCVSGACVCPGTTPLMCSGTCRDGATDPNHCGACGAACPPGVGCVAGVCACPGAMPLVCGGACRDGATDADNCGACGTHCLTSCSGGRCIDSAEVVAGERFSCARLTDGTVRCWGDNSAGQLGDGTLTSRSTPRAVTGLGSVAQVSAGGFHACAVLTDGTVRCWGSGTVGQIGDGSTSGAPRWTPVAVPGLSSVVEVATGRHHTCALRNDGTVLCWGSNGSGQIGDGTSGTNRFSPTPVPGLASVVEIAAGQNSTCARSMDGTMRCWGDNYWGQIGDGTSGAGLIRPSPTLVVGVSSVVEIGMGGSHACCRTTDGSVRCWGGSNEGQVGDGTRTTHTSPTLVTGLAANVASLSVGYRHNCARLDDGTLRCWGWNMAGQIGDGTTGTDRLNPVVVPGVTMTSHISAGVDHTCVRSIDATLRCWGSNAQGQIGDGTTTNRPSPTTVAW